MIARALISLTLLGFGVASVPAVEPGESADEKILKSAGVATESAALLDFLRKRTHTHVERGQVEALIKQLGDEDFAIREQASKKLMALGISVVPALKQALKDGDPEVVNRARRCLETLPADANIDVLLALVRLLGQRKPAEAAETLLGFLPDAADECLQDAILAILADSDLRDARLSQLLVQAVQDRSAIRRMAAVATLAKSPRVEHRAVARRLLEDADVQVRWQTARALLKAGDAAAMPTLLTLVQEGPPLLALQADELLRHLAGSAKPASWLSASDASSRRQCHGLWLNWWQAHQAKIDLGRWSDEGQLGLTTIGEAGKDGNSQVWECAADGKPRWVIKVRNPIAMQLLPGGRVLLADSFGEGQVVEHDYLGKEVWAKTVHWPVSCQRLPNGNTFIATQNELMEVTRGGKTIFSQRHPKFIFGAQKLVNGNIVYLHSNGQIVELDPEGHQLRVLGIGEVTGWGGIDALPNGNCLVARYGANKVIEIDNLGKVLWECEVETPSSVSRLANGNVLVSSADKRKVIELNRDGKVVWEQVTQGRPFCARQR